ncbi:MAG: 50S ribosomal protein L20 [Armatimonadetes bacterium]|nr:50S ribosomal protein L20 [Armatimonadota bacterium]
MARVKRGVTTHRRHKETLAQAKGYWGGRHKLYKTAKEAVMHAQQYAYRDRRNRKRDMRRLWITRINAACRQYGIPYSQFIHALQAAGITLDRKVLADIALQEEAVFAQILQAAGFSIETASA